MKMKNILITFFLTFIVKIGFSQMFNDSIYQHLYVFQTLKGELKKGEICENNLKKSFHIQELIPDLNTKDFKIYKFYNLKHEEVNIDFLVFDNETYGLYDVMSFSLLINNILEEDIDCSVKILWVKEILKILDSYKSVNLDNAIIEKKYNDFLYFIPLGKFIID